VIARTAHIACGPLIFETTVADHHRATCQPERTFMRINLA
jgi:hypothetical protein